MLKINIISNFLGTAYGILLQFALLPFVLKALGAEAYGLVGVFTALVGLFSLLDLGMSPALGRELSRLSAIPDSGNKMRQTVTTLELICGAVSILIGLILFFGSNFLSEHWLNKTTIPQSTVGVCLAWMGIQTALQFMTSYYNSGLLGLQRIKLSNLLSAIMQTIRTVAVLGLLFTNLHISSKPLIEQYFALNMLISAFTLVVTAICLYRVLPAKDIEIERKGLINNIQNRFSLERFKACWRYAAGMTATMLAVMLLTQLDKIILSKILNLEQFGYYSIAANIANAVTRSAPIIFGAVLPRFTQLVALNDIKQLETVYIKSLKLVAWIVLPISGVLILFSEPLFVLYLKNKASAAAIAPLASILTVGNSLHSMMYMPYALSLAFGWTRYGLNISVVASIFLLPIILFGALNYGATGAAYAWLILNIGYMIFSLKYLHSKFLNHLFIKFYTTILVPALIFLVLISAYFMQK